MNRIEAVFSQGKAFIPFLTAGDPSLALTEALLLGLAENGADLIEIGIPFSDPVAEGPVIQAADERALSGGIKTDDIFAMVKRVREKTKTPLAFMTYVNPIFVYGTEKFIRQAAACGIDALIVPDLPFEEREELLPFCQASGVPLISFVAPTSEKRIDAIAEKAEGFIYCVSSLGVTGVRKEISSDAADMIARIKRTKDIPCAIGFGISTPEQAAAMAKIGDGVIVGSAIVKIIAAHGAQSLAPVLAYAKTVKQAISAQG